VLHGTNSCRIAAFAIGSAVWLVWDLQPARQIERKMNQMLFLRAGELEEEFVFAWERESWKPLHWLLVSVGQPEIIF